MTGSDAFRMTLLLLPLVSACGTVRASPPEPVGLVEIIEDKVPIDWRSVITPADLDRLGRIEEAWERGTASALPRFRTAMRSEGLLLDHAAALPRVAPSPGPYLCRVVKLGGRPAFAAFKPFHCFVEAEGELLTMVKQTGTQRPAGRLWAENDTRLVFLGSLSADDSAPPPYAAQSRRDVAGLLERIEPFRWRLVVPFPHDGTILDIYELVPLIPG